MHHRELSYLMLRHCARGKYQKQNALDTGDTVWKRKKKEKKTTPRKAPEQVQMSTAASVQPARPCSAGRCARFRHIDTRTPGTWEHTQRESPAGAHRLGNCRPLCFTCFSAWEWPWTGSLQLDHVLHPMLPEIKYYYFFSPTRYKIHLLKKFFCKCKTSFKAMILCSYSEKAIGP